MSTRKARKRMSNRVYPRRFCKKLDCSELFVPTDNRQLYCCAQHRIDHNNDKRKDIDTFQHKFNKQIKHNKKVLLKIYNSTFYKRQDNVDESLLEYENYNFSTYHEKLFDEHYEREVMFCFDFGIMLIDSTYKKYKIFKR